MSIRARFLWLFIVTLGLAALSAILALSMPNMGGLSWDVFAPSLKFAGYLFGVMLCSIVLERGRFRLLMFAAIAGYVLSCILCWGLIWYPFRMHIRAWEIQELTGRWALTLSLVSAAVTLIAMLRLIKPKGNLLRLIRVMTETCAACFAALSILMAWDVLDTYFMYGPDVSFRVWSALLICSVAGLMGTPALRAVEIARHKDSADSGLPMKIEIGITCPRCERKQSIPTGGASCAGCGLMTHIKVEEPQCPKCGYSLAKLDADTCPECGGGLTGAG